MSADYRCKAGGGFFAAGKEFERALEALGDGAFKVYAWVCLHADRASGRVAFVQRPIRNSGRIASQRLLLEHPRCLTIRVTEGGNMSKISAKARKELVAAVAERYQTGTATEKGCILDEFTALTGYHRKHAIRVLNGNAPKLPGRRRSTAVWRKHGP